jgi:hypothetical protein
MLGEQSPAEAVARSLAQAVEDRSVEHVCALHHPDIELESSETPGLVVRGAAEARRHAERIFGENAMFAVQVGGIEAVADDAVLVRIQLRSSVGPSGHRLGTSWLLWQVKDGALWRQFAGSEQQLRARAGGNDPSGSRG